MRTLAVVVSISAGFGAIPLKHMCVTESADGSVVGAWGWRWRQGVAGARALLRVSTGLRPLQPLEL